MRKKLKTRIRRKTKKGGFIGFFKKIGRTIRYRNECKRLTKKMENGPLTGVEDALYKNKCTRIYGHTRKNVAIIRPESFAPNLVTTASQIQPTFSAPADTFVNSGQSVPQGPIVTGNESVIGADTAESTTTSGENSGNEVASLDPTDKEFETPQTEAITAFKQQILQVIEADVEEMNEDLSVIANPRDTPIKQFINRKLEIILQSGDAKLEERKENIERLMRPFNGSTLDDRVRNHSEMIESARKLVDDIQPDESETMIKLALLCVLFLQTYTYFYEYTDENYFSEITRPNKGIIPILFLLTDNAQYVQLFKKKLIHLRVRLVVAKSNYKPDTCSDCVLFLYNENGERKVDTIKLTTKDTLDVVLYRIFQYYCGKSKSWSAQGMCTYSYAQLEEATRSRTDTLSYKFRKYYTTEFIPDEPTKSSPSRLLKKNEVPHEPEWVTEGNEVPKTPKFTKSSAWLPSWFTPKNPHGEHLQGEGQRKLPEWATKGIDETIVHPVSGNNEPEWLREPTPSLNPNVPNKHIVPVSGNNDPDWLRGEL